MGLEVLGYPPGMERTPGGSQESPGTPQAPTRIAPPRSATIQAAARPGDLGF